MPIPLIKKFNSAAEEQPLLGMLVYAFIGFLRPAIYIFLLPLYLNVFSEAEYGLYDLMIIIGYFVMVIIGLRLNAAMLTQYYDYQGAPEKQKHFLNSLFSFSLWVAGAFVLISYFVGPAVFDFLFKSEDASFFPYGFTILCYAALSEVNACYFIYLKNEKNLGRYSLVVLTQIILAIVFQFIFIIPLQAGVQGALFGMLLANVLTTLLIILLERGIITFKPDMEMIKVALRFSVNLIPYLLVYWFLSKGGKMFLERYADLATVGIFALLMTIAGVIIMIVEAVVNGVRPFLFETFAKEKAVGDEDKIALFTKLIINIPLLAIPVIVLVGSNINLITTTEGYIAVGQYVTLASLVVFILVHGKLFYQQLIFVKKSNLVTRLSFVVLIVIAIGFYLLVPEYKIWGVLIATLIANALMAVLFYFAAQKEYPVQYNMKYILLVPALIFILLFLLEWFCVYSIGMSRALFSIIQFVLLTGLILSFNLNTIPEYRKLFVKSGNE